MLIVFLCLCLGLFIANCCEVCRHSEGQRAEAHGSTAAATDATAQCCFHVGKSLWAQQFRSTVLSSKCVFIQNTITVSMKQIHKFKCWVQNVFLLQLYLQLLQQSASTGNALNSLHPVSGTCTHIILSVNIIMQPAIYLINVFWV